MTLLDSLRSGAATVAGAFTAIGDSYAWAAQEDRRALGALEHDLPLIAERLKAWAQHENPEPVFAVLRELKPVLVLGEMALVTRFEDVQEVLSRPDAFGVTYAAKFAELTGGRNFFLGMDGDARYTRDVSNMRLAVRREAIASRVAPVVTRAAESIVDAAGGRLDVVRELGVGAPEALAAEYFGTPSPTPGDYATWSATMSGYLFLPPSGGNAATQGKAVAQAGLMRAALARTLAERRARGDDRDDVLGRCLAMQRAGLPGMDDETLLVNLFGIVIGALPTTGALLALAIDELLRRPAALAQAQMAARAGATRLVWQYMAEALRFNPLGPGVFRVALDDYEVAGGTPHATTIPRGTTVLASLSSAMMAGRRVDDPHVVKGDRPEWQYMHFAYGLHTCFGQYLNLAQLPLLATALLRRRNLRRAEGAAGALRKDGPFPSALVVEYDVESGAESGA